ncbi:MAG: aminotransferase class V-fold PLP-dependent enzyme [Planctomycetes bacterium]|nr:aminotransferase class V-fold PLP-dependent enzyme [Planctomycetota bacterium]
MVQTPVYMDNQATTRVDPRVVEAMLPLFHEQYGNAGSTSHVFGWDAKEAVDQAREYIALAIGATAREIVFTSGATESNNLAIRGCAERTRRRGNHIISVATEHKAILDPLTILERRDFETTLLPVRPSGDAMAGVLDVQRVADAIRDDTLLVSVMLANNEIGVVQPMAEIGALCKERGVLFHTDATQAVGKIPLDVDQLEVDLLSFSAHKLYGPKGVGALYIRRRAPMVRLTSQIDGGGQEGGRRSGTLNVPGVVGFATALKICLDEMERESTRLADLRDRLFDGLTSSIDNVTLNGPALSNRSVRLAGNLSCSFADVDGEALMMSMRDLCVSSGSACTSSNPEPSHVLRALGLGDDLTRSSLRFGLGRFNTVDEVDFAIGLLADAVHRLRSMSSLA